MTHNTVKIEVIDSNNRILANTSRYRHVRRLLESGRATIVCRAPFTIKLLYTVDSPKTNKTLERARIREVVEVKTSSVPYTLTNKTSERARTREFVKAKTGFITYTFKYSKNREAALAVVDAICALPQEDREFYFTFDSILYFVNKYYEQSRTHHIFNYRAYIFKVVKNHNASRNSAKESVQPTTNVPNTNKRNLKIANHKQRNWDFDKIKRLTCDTEDACTLEDACNTEITCTECTTTEVAKAPQDNYVCKKFVNFEQRGSEYWDQAFDAVLRASYEDADLEDDDDFD